MLKQARETQLSAERDPLDVMLDSTDQRYVLQVKDLSKSFPGVKALDGVRLEVERGTVHALMGENGAGKSTLMRILIGLQPPDAGEIWIKGRRVALRSPHEALQHGIAMIHQELLPFPDLTVAENLFMGHEPVSGPLGWIDRKTLHREATRLLERLGLPVATTRRMKELSVAEMQTVEIAKALAHRAEVIIMDEPTSAISNREVEALFRVIRDLKQQGVAVIYISHKMEEVFQIADTVTVLRDGCHVATSPLGALTQPELIRLMVGRELGTGFTRTPHPPGEEALAVRGLTQPGQFRDITFAVRRGEILGFAGLMGAGRTEVMRALYGLAPAESGEILVDGRPVRIGSPAEAMAHGIAWVSEDRKREGLVLNLPVDQNLTLSSLARFCRGGFIHGAAARAVADEQIRAYSIKTPDRRQPVLHLSGGNQQKVVLAKALLCHPTVLILDEPTRGIDVGAKREIYALMARLAREGLAILMVSSELPEILSLSDRILVMRQGALTAELDSHQTSPEMILKYAMPA